MASYHTFTSARSTEPDPTSLLTLLRATDATTGVAHRPGTPTYVVKRTTDTAWTAPEIVAAQASIDTAPAASPSLQAQATIALWPIELRALVFALIDRVNLLQAALVALGSPAAPLQPITPAQVLAAIVNKAKTLAS